MNVAKIVTSHSILVSIKLKTANELRPAQSHINTNID